MDTSLLGLCKIPGFGINGSFTFRAY